jgi:hypothetical protein
MFWPANLQLTYSHLANRPLWEVILAATILIGITIAATILRKNAPYLIIGWLWYLGMLVPVTGLVIGWPSHADRYTYLPQIGLYIAGTWAVVDLTASWRRQRMVLGTAALLVIGVLSWSARIQTSYWRNTETLFNHAPSSYRFSGPPPTSPEGGTACWIQFPEKISQYFGALFEISPAARSVSNPLLFHSIPSAARSSGAPSNPLTSLGRALKRLPRCSFTFR